jgi:hypothetical protein
MLFSLESHREHLEFREVAVDREISRENDVTLASR